MPFTLDDELEAAALLRRCSNRFGTFGDKPGSVSAKSAIMEFIRCPSARNWESCRWLYVGWTSSVETAPLGGRFTLNRAVRTFVPRAAGSVVPTRTDVLDALRAVTA